jgi:hypothetical protein
MNRWLSVHLTLFCIAKNLLYRFTLSLGLLFIACTSEAQVKFTTVASSHEIGRSDYVQIEFVVENAKEIEHLTPPSFADFHVVQGPIQSSGMSIINGDMSQYKSLSFVLQPVKTGKFTVGSASATVDGKLMHSNPVTIEVNSSSSSNGGPAVPNNPFNPSLGIQPFFPGDAVDIDREYLLKPGENVDEKIRKNLFVKLQVSKTSCYVGEPIVATYKLYSRLQSESRVTKHPSLNGFSVYDMLEPNGDAVSVETVNGKPFTVHTIRKTQLIPLQSGTIDLDPVEIENTVHFVKSNQSKARKNSLQDLFDQLTEETNPGTPVEKNITLDSKPVAITVKPLPEESKPLSFNGAVGHFGIDASVDEKHIRAQDAGILKVTIKGSGNLPVVNAPVVSWPPGFETYDPGTKESIDKTTAPMTGSKTFEYSFIPKEKGKYSIPSIEFSYFDPVSASYKTVETKPVDLDISAAKKNAAGAVDAHSPNNSKGESAESDHILIEYIEWFFVALVLFVLAFYFWRPQIRKNRASQAAKQPVPPAAEPGANTGHPAIRPDPLMKTRQLLENGDYKGFYNELNAAVWNAVSNQLQLPSSELNKYNIAQALRSKGWKEEKVNLLKQILNECEMSLYTPDYDSRDMQLLLENTTSLLDQLG